MASLFDVFSSGDDERAAREAAAARVAGFNTGRDTATGALNAGFDRAAGYYDRALTPFTSLFDRGSRGYDTYLDATGVNGAEGVARAGDLFKSLPGYSGGLNTGVDLLERRAAARGDLGGGNASADTIRFASDYDAGKFKDFLSALQPNLSMASGAATGQAGVLGKTGDLAADVGTRTADYGYRAATGSGEANANAITQAQQARNQASSNFWNALMGGASLAISAGTGMPFSFGGGSRGGSGGSYSLNGGGGGNFDFSELTNGF